MGLIVLSLSPQNLHLLFCFVLSILAFMWLVLMALSYRDIRRNSVFLLRFPFFSHVQVFSCEMSLVCRRKRLYCSFSSNVCFLVLFVVLILMPSELFLVVVISLHSRYSMLSSSRYIDASTLSSMVASPLSPFLNTYNLSTLSLRCNALFMVINFLVFWSICWSPSLIHFKNGPEYITRERQPRHLSILEVPTI